MTNTTFTKRDPRWLNIKLPFTLNDDLLHGLFQGDGGVARPLEEALNQILQAQVTEQLQAAPDERTEKRQGYGNGTYPQPLTTRVGRLTFRVPRIRGGSFSPDLFLRDQRSEQCWHTWRWSSKGSPRARSPRSPRNSAARSFSAVSALCKRLDAVVQAWNGRPSNEHWYPFVLVDALVLKVREDGRVRLRSAMIATGINDEGDGEILGVMPGDSESETGWRALFSWLKERGLSRVDVVVADSHSGLVKALLAHFSGCTWQRCQTHFRRNLLDATPKSLQAEVDRRARAMLGAPDLKTARLLLHQAHQDLGDQAPKAMQVLEGFDDVTAVLALPERYRRRLWTTNGVERLNEEICRQERVRSPRCAFWEPC